jgi:dienelactone hydrolase
MKLKLSKKRVATGAGCLIVFLVVLSQILIPLVVALVVVYRPRPDCCDSEGDLGKPYEDVEFATSGGVNLSGWYVPSENRAAIIVLHGAWGNRTKVIDHARLLAEHGYGVLMFDLSGDNWALGWEADQEVAAAIAYLQTRPEVDPDRIGGLGLSLGAESLLQSAARLDDLHAVVAEGAGARSENETRLLEHRDRGSIVPTWIMMHVVDLLSGQDAPPALNTLVPQIAPRPILLISAGNVADEVEFNQIYYAAAGEPKTLWEIPDTGHTRGLATHPEEYETRVIDFFDAALLGK